MNKKILIAVVALLVLGGGGAGAFFFFQGGEADPAAGEVADAAPVEEPLADPIYLALSPAFLVNFDHNGTIRYLQIELQVMARDEDIIDKVESNMPAVRNQVIMLLSAQDYDAVSTVEGKDKLRKEVLGAVNDALQLTGEEAVEDAFFTNFVVQ